MAIDIEDKDLGELLNEYIDQEKLYSLEGARGVRNITKVINAIGYSDMDDFLQDNPGALEAIFNWISDLNISEWKESIAAKLHGGAE